MSSGPIDNVFRPPYELATVAAALVVGWFVLRSPAWGLAWAFKIITDPIHNVQIYWRSPVALLRGERLDPMQAPRH